MLTDWRYASIPALSVLPVCCLQHTFPMAFLSRQSLKAMLSLGKGFLTEKEAMKHAALWVKEDLEIERNAFERQSDQNQTILREKRLN